MNVRIYSRGEKSLEWMSEYIRFEKIHEYLGEWIYSTINIWIYLNIRIFATQWIEATVVIVSLTMKYCTLNFVPLKIVLIISNLFVAPVKIK